MTKFLAILVCKLLHLAGSLVGRGSSLPGKYALKICPDILGRIQLPRHIIAVTGSNGKTSTVEMIAAVLRAGGKTVVYNAEGSNQIEGITTAVLSHASLGGVLSADVLLLESDERYAAQSFRYFHPTEFVVTNLYRDQLTRNGHPEWVYDALAPAMHPESRLILNADDPLSSCFGAGRGNVIWFGLNECAISTKEPTGMYHDGAYCPLCKEPMQYFFYHYNQIGGYLCKNCGHSRPVPTYAGTALDLEAGTLQINEKLTIHLALRSIYNVYNILAAFATCIECGIQPTTVTETLNHYILKNGRVTQFLLGAHHGTLLISKHENSVAYDTNLRYIRDLDEPCMVMVIVDAVSRKYYTSETSWLWDINFDLLDCPHVQRIILTGQYAGDLSVRFAYSQVPPEKIQIISKIDEACKLLKEVGGDDLYVVTCFSDRDKLLSQVEQAKKEAV